VTGKVEYTYEYTKELKMKVDFGAMSACICENNGEESTVYVYSCDYCTATNNPCSKYDYGSFKECIGPK